MPADDSDDAEAERGRTPRSRSIDELRGCVTAETKAPGPSISPRDLKADWTSDLPTGDDE